MSIDQTRRLGFGPRRTVTDFVFDDIYQQVLRLELPPGARLSELEVAKRLGVSRQPVRDAFYRLSQLGMLLIKPQRATSVTHISVEAIFRAQFVRTALEIETIRALVAAYDPQKRGALEANLAAQAEAVARHDPDGFRALDDAFHHAICILSGNEFAWTLIRENKAHMDRAGYLSLSSDVAAALDDHRRILSAVDAGDAALAADEMRMHLSRIRELVWRIRSEKPECFSDAACPGVGQSANAVQCL